MWVGTCDVSNDNWLPIAKKVKQVLNLWGKRNLTIFGRTQIVKINALSKLWYVATVTVPPKLILEDITKAVWDFIWAKKRQAVSREKCYKHNLEGGINMIDIETQCQCLRLKWLVTLLENKHKSDATKLSHYFLNNFDKSFKSIQVITTKLKNFRNENVPKFYIDLLESWHKIGLKRIKPGKVTQILDEYIWLNPEVTHNNDAIYDPIWIQAGFTKMRDIWNCNTKSWIDQQFLIQRFPKFFQNNQRGIVAMFRKMQNAIEVNGWLKTLKDNLGQDSEEPEEINYLRAWYGKQAKEMTCKAMYNSILEPKQKEPTHPVDQNAKKWWKSLYDSNLDRKIQELLWKSFHNALPLGVKLKEWFAEDGLCVFCKSKEENLKHLFIECNFAKGFLKKVCENIGIHKPLEEQGLIMNWCNRVDKRQFYFLGICKKVIWDLRNNCKFHERSVNVDVRSFLFNFKYMLKSHLENLYNVYHYKKKEDEFMNIFINGNSICSMSQTRSGKIDVKLL